MSYPPTLLLRANASTEVGVGHVMRCMALGQAWQGCGGKVLFVTHCPPALHQKLANLGFEVIYFDSIPSTKEDLRKCEEILQNHPGSTAIIDGYLFDRAFQSAIRKNARVTLVIDDMGHLPYYDCDFLLNQNAHAARLNYSHSPDCHLLLGPRYTLLRESLREIARRGKKPEETVKRMALSMGGSDPTHATLQCLNALLPLLADLELDVIVGPASQDLEKITTLTKEVAQITVRSHVPEVGELFYDADLVLTAGGVTSLELAAIGTPFLTLLIAENQRGNLEELVAQGVTLDLGNSERFDPGSFRQVVQQAISDAKLRQTLSQRGRELVDGKTFDRLLPLLLPS